MQAQKVLIVDDEAIIGYDLELRLRRLGFDVLDVASSPDEAYLAATSKHPDVILMDINLNSEKDGIATYKWIRESIDIPVMFISAFADHETLDRVNEVGPLGYLTKPVYDDQLEYIIQKLGATGARLEQQT